MSTNITPKTLAELIRKGEYDRASKHVDLAKKYLPALDYGKFMHRLLEELGPEEYVRFTHERTYRRVQQERMNEQDRQARKPPPHVSKLARGLSEMIGDHFGPQLIENSDKLISHPDVIFIVEHYHCAEPFIWWAVDERAYVRECNSDIPRLEYKRQITRVDKLGLSEAVKYSNDRKPGSADLRTVLKMYKFASEV